jgi:hypothetical protein
MSLRFRLIGLIAIVLAVSLAIDGTIVFFNASRSVQTEMRSALQVGEQIVKSALKLLPELTDRRRGLEELVAAFNGNRHLRVSLTGREIVSSATILPVSSLTSFTRDFRSCTSTGRVRLQIRSRCWS